MVTNRDILQGISQMEIFFMTALSDIKDFGKEYRYFCSYHIHRKNGYPYPTTYTKHFEMY